MTTHLLGYPRIGAQRQLKQVLECYWRGELTQAQLLATGKKLRAEHWQQQADAGIELLPVGDFAWYDQVLTLSATLGNLPARHHEGGDITLDTLFRVARGRAPTGNEAPAAEMTKWFNSNYHYLVPELTADQHFSLSYEQIFDEISEAQALDHQVKPVLIGPVTYLWLAKTRGESFDKLSLLPGLLAVYQQILARFSNLGIQWVQLDEPILTLDLPADWQQALIDACQALHTPELKLLLTTYFGAIDHHSALLPQLKVDGLHLDLINGPTQLETLLPALPEHWVISAGIINGRNVWAADLDRWQTRLAPLKQQLGQRLWLAPSCSLLHCPLDLDSEQQLDDEARSWLAFAKQKLSELTTLKQALAADPTALKTVAASRELHRQKAASSRINNPQVQQKLNNIDSNDLHRQTSYKNRVAKQRQALALPDYPTTTIGSFPQTDSIRRLRRRFKNGDISQSEYHQGLKRHIGDCIDRQQQLGLDLLVHGEAERNDMVEYFGEQLDGFLFSQFGWVQSYGSRCVKPPIIFGDISRTQPMTVEWSRYAQSLTDTPVKGMLTGPVTLLFWSFYREDISKEQIARQLALALKDEVADLEQAGIKAIQLDEPAFREGLPLRKQDWQPYLDWAVDAFRLSSAHVRDETQIHTHMCYSQFNDIIAAIAAMDADVITIETSRSAMGLLDAFEDFAYPNDIGPGVYDIHSPNQPSIEQMVTLIAKARQRIPAQQLWVNPDCGLKTRAWSEVEPALANLVAAAKQLRSQAALAS